MEHLYKNGRYFFAIGFIAFGIMHFIFGDFITGRAPSWPEHLPGQFLWAAISGVIIALAGFAIFAEKGVRFLAFLAAGIIFAWALLRQLPVAGTGPILSGAWTQLGKALVFGSGILAVAGSYPKTNYNGFLSELFNSEKGVIKFGFISIALYLILCGVQHFLFVEFVASLIPGIIPWKTFWTYFAGVCLIAGGLGLLIPATKKLAAFLSGLMIFSWVFIVHLPLAINGFSQGGVEWIAVFEAFAISGLLFFLVAAISRQQQASLL